MPATEQHAAEEAARVRNAYAQRAQRGADDRYALTDSANLYLYQRRERALLDALRKHRLLPLAGKRVLDVGCGNGNLLRDVVRYGATSSMLTGVDLLGDRIDSATPFAIANADAAALPFSEATFDIVLQFTLLSSVLDEATRRAICAEASRVLRPGGAVILYDFVWNPTNRDTRGVTLGELRVLYPNCLLDARRVTLAPPISRRLARVSWTLCRLLEMVPPLCSHQLVVARKAV